MKRRAMTLGAPVILLLLAIGVAEAQEERPTWPSQYYAPYVYPGTHSLANTAESAGIRYYTLAFILAGRECVATWGGSALLENMPLLADELARLRELGGDVMVSFGGASGTELAQACTDVDGLAAQYQAVVDAYQVTHLDFDIEGDEIRDAASIERRSQALAVLQSRAAEAGGAIQVAFTLPTLPTGLTDDGLAVLQSALDNGVEIDVVNIMTMNFGEAFPPDKMADNTLQAAGSLFEQLKALYPEKTDTEVWGMIGLTPMIGMNDSYPEVFTLEDAEAVTAFAEEKGIRRISMWALSRDQECVSGVSTVSIRCSGVLQEPLAYSAIFNQITESS